MTIICIHLCIVFYMFGAGPAMSLGHLGFTWKQKKKKATIYPAVAICDIGWDQVS